MEGAGPRDAAEVSQYFLGVNGFFVAGTNDSPQENCHNNSSHHGSDLHAAQSKPAERVGPESPNEPLLFLCVIQIFWDVLEIKSDWLRLTNDLSDNTNKPTTNAFVKTPKQNPVVDAELP